MFHEGLKQLAEASFVTPAQPSLSLEASKGQSLRHHHPTLPEMKSHHILAMKRSYTLGFLTSCFPVATSSTGSTASEPVAPKVPNLFSQLLASYFLQRQMSKRKSAALSVLQSRPHLEPANRKWSPHICIGEIGVELTGFSCCMNVPCRT